jgi:hypothetical protein
VASVQLVMGHSAMANSKQSSDKPNHSSALEMSNGKYAVYVMFTREELESIQAHCNGMRINMSKWISILIKEELALNEILSEDET